MTDATDDMDAKPHTVGGLSQVSRAKMVAQSNSEKRGFDSWVMDEQEKAAVAGYEKYINDNQFNNPSNILNFEDWCHDNASREL